MSTNTKTVFLTDENGNLLVDSNGRLRALTFTVIEGKSLRLAERETIPTVTYAELKTYSESVQTYTGITNTAKFSVEDVAVFQYIVSDRGNTRAYITAQVSAVNDTSLTANGIGISVAGADGKNGATPEIGENGNWFINGQDTGKPSKGAKGDDGKSITSATAGTVSEADGYTVTPVTFGLSDGNSLPAVSVKAKNAESEIIDLGEVTLTEQSLGGISMATADNITVSAEQATLAQADNPPIVKIRFDNDDHEFFRTKISTDASALYILFTATEDMGEGTRFYNLQITISRTGGGASAMLLVWKYNLLDGILNEFDIGTLTFTEDTATRTVTDDEWTLVQGANVIAFRISATSGTTTTIDERFKMYLTHYHAGESNPDSVDLYNRSYFGVVTTQSGTPYGYSAVYDSENKQIIVTKVSLGSGGGGGGLQVQAFEYGQNSSLLTLYNVLAGLAGQSKKIIAVEFESFNSLPNVKFTVNNVEYEGFVASITPSNDGYFTVSGQAFAPEAISTAYSLFLINVGAGKFQFVPFVQGLSYNDTAPIDVVWGASGTLYVYYQ